MKKRLLCLFISFAFILSISSGMADKSEGDLYTFCPAMGMLTYNSLLQNYFDLNDSQAAILQLSSDGFKDGNLVYSDVLQDTFFFFGGVSSEYDTATTVYIYCSLKDDSTLKNIPMILWAGIIDIKYNGEIKETGSSFLEWVNEGKSDGDTYTSPYFTASYNHEPNDNCTLLLVKR